MTNLCALFHEIFYLSVNSFIWEYYFFIIKKKLDVCIAKVKISVNFATFYLFIYDLAL